jgi:endonuclease/exonuclease/phosphatase family metal-dependent hydrolase
MKPPTVAPARRGSRQPARSLAALLLALAVSAVAASPAFALRVMTYNILNYPGSTGNSREDDYRVVLTELAPDLIVTQEILGSTGANQFLSDVLDVLEPGAWALAPFFDGNDTDNACYYRISALDYLSKVILSTTPRVIEGFEFRLDGYTGSAATLRIYSAHLKASQTTDDENQRLAEAQTLRNHLQALPAGTHFFLGGDLNIYTSSEPAWIELTGSQVDNSGRLFDPINMAGPWHNNASYAAIHTQSTRTVSLPDGGSTGGMDDRFDMLLVNDDLQNGQGIDVVGGSYVAFGQDGQHFNKALIDAPPNAVVSTATATALYNASDHLPVAMDLQVPAFLAYVADLDFGPVLVGTPAQRGILVLNTATPPADDLAYSLSAGPGLSVPAGTVSVAPGGLDSPVVTLDTSSPAAYATSVTITSNWPNDPSVPLPATATVLAPSSPSLDGGAVVLGMLLDFGEQEIGEFTPQDVDVFNLGYTSLQTLLEVYDAQIGGADAGRFSVPAFTSTLVGGSNATFSVVFDDTGATEGTTYAATLTLKSRDDPSVLGAQGRPDLVVGLEATIKVTGTPAPTRPLWTTRLYPNVPNPFNPSTTIRFDVARPAHVTITVYTVQGRAVRHLLDRDVDEGRHEIVWNGRSDTDQEMASGVYFFRMETGSMSQTRRMTLVR